LVFVVVSFFLACLPLLPFLPHALYVSFSFIWSLQWYLQKGTIYKAPR
jgi:hypothetical protein